MITCFFVFIGIGISCKKENKQIKVWGYVSDAAGNKISGVKVNLQGTLLQGGSYSSGFSDIVAATTDANGNYELKADWQVVDKYRITLFKQNYFDTYTDYLSNDIPSGSEVNKNLTLNPVAWIKITVNNVSPYDDSDQISYYYDNTQSFSCIDCCNNNPIIGYGMIYSNTLVCRLKGNANAKISWVVKKDDIIQSYNHNVFCTAFDTTEYVINY